MNRIFSSLLFISCLSTRCYAHEESDDHIMEFFKLPSQLPIGLSDMTATHTSDWNGDGVEAIILTGGCSAEVGNLQGERDNETVFECQEVTDDVYVFFPSTETTEKVADMPSPRYRHSAGFLGGKLYVVGGRTLFDDIVKDIIVYDPRANKWTTFMTLDDSLAASDQGMVAREETGSLYMLGGYSAIYDTHDRVFSLNVETKEIVNLASMKQKRGDANAVYYDVNGMKSIFIMGGFTGDNLWCAPLDHGEMYDFKTNKWTDIDPLENKRGDKSVVVFKEEIIAIGGEDKHESICLGKQDGVDPGSHAVAIDDVETFNPQDGAAAEWHVESDFPVVRFRSAAAVSTKLNKIYVFGGQLPYDVDCKCYRTSRDIFYYRDNGASGRKIGFALGIVASSVVALLW